MRLFFVFVGFLFMSVGGLTAQESAGSTVIKSTSRSFNICAEPESWGTSSDYLQEAARCAYGVAPDDPTAALRVALIEDIYIKSWSYAWLNKVFFWASIIFGITVLIWPSLVAFLRADPAQEAADEAQIMAKGTNDDVLEVVKQKRSALTRLVGVSSMQTTVTALAALSFAFYAHYKDKQTTAEGLMRTVLYAEVLDDTLVDQVVTQMTTMDRGFGFAKALPSIAKANDAPPD